jgi:hypothetical protein
MTHSLDDLVDYRWIFMALSLWFHMVGLLVRVLIMQFEAFPPREISTLHEAASLLERDR